MVKMADSIIVLLEKQQQQQCIVAARLSGVLPFHLIGSVEKQGLQHIRVTTILIIIAEAK